MRLLLDTHAFLVFVMGGRGLPRKARSAIANPRNECAVSLVSCWEIAIKASLGKIRLSTSIDRFLPEQLAANGFRPLGIDLRHCARVAALPFHHRDPFDRLLAAQALEEELTIVSSDAIFEHYAVKRVW